MLKLGKQTNVHMDEKLNVSMKLMLKYDFKKLLFLSTQGALNNEKLPIRLMRKEKGAQHLRIMGHEEECNEMSGT